MKREHAPAFAPLANQGVIWLLGLGYFLFYIPYASLTKATTNGLIPGVDAVAGVEILPISALATLIVLYGLVSIGGWWRLTGSRRIGRLDIPLPRKATVVSGIATAVIIGTTTMAFSFDGVSIVFSLILMRGGVLLIGRITDAVRNRRVPWTSMAGMVLTLTALFVLFSENGGTAMTIPAAINLGLYLSGYTVRFQIIDRLTKTEDQTKRVRYFVEELMVAGPALVLILALLAVMVPGTIGEGLRGGFTEVWTSAALIPALLIGVGYGCLYVFGTMIYLDAREYTFCVPINRAASLLSGVVATYILYELVDYAPVSPHQLAGAALLLSAIGVLAIPTLAGGPLAATNPVNRLFLFVCDGNRLRSPMARALCRAHLAAMLETSADALHAHGIAVESAGLTAKPGSAMKPFGIEALTHLGHDPEDHAARQLTPAMLHRAERVFCMTRAQRQAIIALDPTMADKVICLDGEGDIGEPTDRDSAIAFARHVETLLRHRFAESAP